MRSCTACGAENPTQARFCVHCGAALASACQRCGVELPGPVRFCPSCGAPVAEAAPAGEERKVVTVLFADVTGSTGLGERLDPEQLKEVMADYFAAMREEIEAGGGTVEKFIGDAVMAAFGVPAAHEDDPERALRAAGRMQRRLAELNTSLQEIHGIALQVRIGVNTGEVVATSAPRPGEGMVAGDAVNVAARLEQAAEPGQVVVSERTARASRGLRFREIGPLALKGRAEPVQALELLGEEPTPDRGVPGLRAPMVGREREIALLQTLYERVAGEGNPHLVTIYGDPGVGKSRLIAEFLGWSEGGDPRSTVVRGRCLPYGEGVTYWPLAEILKGLAGVLDSDPPATTLDKIRRTGREIITAGFSRDAARATAALAYTVGIVDPEVPFREIEPRQVRLETHTAWRSFFSALAARGPVIAVVEDIHWAGSALLDLLEDLADRARGPLLFVCSARPELSEGRPGRGGGRRNFSSIFLELLSSADADRLVDLLLAVENIPPGLRRTILERAEGNPFFLEEIVRQLIDEGRIVREGARWRGTADLAEVTIPDTIQAVLAARIDLLGPVEKRVVQCAAVVGRVFWTGPVGLLLNGEAERLEEALERLEERELVLARLSSGMEGQREFIFKHILTRDVAYESLPKRDRVRAHARVAEWIEDTAGERRLEFVELLAHHFAEAHRMAAEDPRFDPDRTEALRAKAFEYLLLASDDARSKLVVDKAVGLAQRALAVVTTPLERALAHESLGRAYAYDYEGDLAWQHLRDALEIRLDATPDDRHAIAWLVIRALDLPLRWGGWVRTFPGQEEIDRYLDIGLSSVEEGDSEEAVRLLTMVSFNTNFQRFGGLQATEAQLLEARRAGERAAAMALRLGRPDLASAALDGVGSFYVENGLYGPMTSTIEQRLRLVPSLDDPWEVGDTLNMAAWWALYLGRHRDAFRHADEGFERRASDFPAFALQCLSWRAIARFRLGDWEGCLEDIARGQALLGERRESPPPYFGRHLGAAALIHELRGNRAEADHILAIARPEAAGDPFRRGLLEVWTARILGRRGSFAEAAALMDPGLYGSARGWMLEALCDLVAEQGAWTDAAEVLSRAREHAEEAGLLALPFFADRLEGRVALAAGDHEEAVRLLRLASDGFERLEAPWERACTDLSLAEALIAAEKPDDGRACLGRALSVFLELRSVREIERARELLGLQG